MSEMQGFLKKKQLHLKFRFTLQVPLGSIEKRKDKTDEADKTDERISNEGAKFSPE